MLFILHNTEDGVSCEIIKREDFDRWVRDRTEGVRPECHPRFVRRVPDAESEYEYLMIEGEVITPTPVTVVKAYTLPG